MGEVVLYHGSKEAVEFPRIRVARYSKNFYYGFYCTLHPEQAKRRARRFSGKGMVSEYLHAPCEALRVKRFPGMTEEWLDFIVACRQGVAHDYDIVEGPMTDDAVFNYVEVFASGKISREAFWALAASGRLSRQISFHTARALASLRFLRSYEVENEG